MTPTLKKSLYIVIIISIITIFYHLFFVNKVFSEPDSKQLAIVFQKEIDHVNANLAQTYSDEDLPKVLVTLESLQKTDACTNSIENSGYELYDCPVEAVTNSQLAGSNTETFRMLVNSNELNYYTLKEIRK